jgi:hypothetical protein
VTDEVEESEPTEGPSNAEVEAKVAELMSGADLQTITEKNVREQLGQIFGVRRS